MNKKSKRRMFALPSLNQSFLNPVLGLLLCVVLTYACKDDEKVSISGLDLDRTEIPMDAKGGEETVCVSSEEEWVARSSAPWVSVSPANGLGTTECVITIDEALGNEVREAEVQFVSAGQNTKAVFVTQLGYGKMIHVKETDVKLKSSDLMENRHFEAVVTSNVAFDIEYDWLTEKEGTSLKDWIDVEEKNKPKFDLESARPQSFKIRFDWKMNPEWIERQAKINFVPKQTADKDAETTPVTVTQEASPEITDNRAGDSLAVLLVRERLQASSIDQNEKLDYWNGVTLWERNDKKLPEKDAVGRVRSLDIQLIATKESIPTELKYLKYLESLKIGANENTMFLDIDLGNDICDLKYLKYLQISGYGLVSLPDDLVKLGETLETLDLTANNFQRVPEILTQENFPKLKNIVLNANRRWVATSLKDTQYDKDKELGFHINLDETPDGLDRLLFWDNLEELHLSYNFMEGTLPKYEDRPVWTEEDLREYGDTLNYLKDHPIPKILPNIKRLALNLNYFTGELPDWLLYHPKLMEWYPEVMVFNQQEGGFDSNGKKAKFSNTPVNFEYYFEAYPLYRAKYELKEEE